MGASVVKSARTETTRRRTGRSLVLAVCALALLWITFFDSHSLIKRLRWHNERDALRTENALLTREIERLEREVEKGISDEVVEAVAREQYGMRRPGEVVYRVETAD